MPAEQPGSRSPRPKASRIALATLTLTLVPVSVASAYELEAPRWRNQINVNFKQADVANGRFVRDGGTLAARSQKPNGGYFYNPVCVTADGRVGAATPDEWNGIRYTFKCLGGDGETITNGSDFTWEYKAQVANRGSISIYSLTYEHNGQTRVICKGKVGGEELPGWLPLPAAGGVPGKCNVLVMGQTVAATDFHVARHVPRGTGQPSLTNGAGWISRPEYEKGPQSEALFRTTTRDGSEVLCRHKRNGKWWPGVLVAKSYGSKKPGFACSAFIGTSNPYVSVDYEVYVSSKRTSKFGWEKSGSTTDFSKAVVLDPGTSASTRRYACQSGSSIGYAEGGSKRCRIPINPSSGTAKFRTHMK